MYIDFDFITGVSLGFEYIEASPTGEYGTSFVIDLLILRTIIEFTE
jgi:hypothetical protein